MNFQDLHEVLRLEVLRRIGNGDLTGTRLAQEAGFQQAHISNFLNRKRALSLEGLDRVLASQGLSVEEILPIAIAASADVSAGRAEASSEEVTMVPIVSAVTAAEEGQVHLASVIESLPVVSSWLSGHRSRPAPRSAGWQRFVGVRVDTQQAAAMEPALAPGMIAVIDRHYNSIAPYRAHQPTVFAVRHASGMLLRYVELDEGHLVLRPSAIDCAVQVITIAPEKTPVDYIVGRVCVLLNEL